MVTILCSAALVIIILDTIFLIHCCYEYRHWKCPTCGGRTVEIYDKLNGSTYRICRKCGKKWWVNY